MLPPRHAYNALQSRKDMKGLFLLPGQGLKGVRRCTEVKVVCLQSYLRHYLRCIFQ